MDQVYVIVLIWHAMVGGEVQMVASEQPSMALCTERLDQMMMIERVPGEKIQDQQTWMDVTDKKGKCVKMTVADLFAVGD